MSILAIDAGTTGVTALVVDPEGTIAARGYQEFRAALPASRAGSSTHPEEIWQATLEAARDCLKDWDGSPATSPASASPTSARRCCSGTARRSGSPRRAIVWQDRRTADICRRMRDEGHEDRVTELTGLRLDPYFSGTKLVWLAENEPNTWALVERRSLRDRHRRLLPDRPDDPRHLAHHRRLQRLPHAALRPRGRRAGPRSCATCSACRWTPCRRSCPTGASWRTTDPKSFLDLELPDRRHRRRPAVGAVRPDLLRRGRLQVHLRHRLVHPDQHRRPRWSAPTPACSPRRPGSRPTATLTYALEGRDLRDRRGGAVAARRPADRRLRGRDRGDRRHGRQHRRRGVRARR